MKLVGFSPEGTYRMEAIELDFKRRMWWFLLSSYIEQSYFCRFSLKFISKNIIFHMFNYCFISCRNCNKRTLKKYFSIYLKIEWYKFLQKFQEINSIIRENVIYLRFYDLKVINISLR